MTAVSPHLAGTCRHIPVFLGENTRLAELWQQVYPCQYCSLRASHYRSNGLADHHKVTWLHCPRRKDTPSLACIGTQSHKQHCNQSALHGCSVTMVVPLSRTCDRLKPCPQHACKSPFSFHLTKFQSALAPTCGRVTWLLAHTSYPGLV